MVSGALVLKDRSEHGDYDTFPTLVMWPSLIPSHSFSTWSCFQRLYQGLSLQYLPSSERGLGSGGELSWYERTL